MATFLPTYVGNFSGGAVSGSVGTFATSVTTPTANLTTAILGGAASTGSGILTISQASGATTWPVWIYDNANSRLLMGLQPSGILSVGGVQTTTGDVLINTAPSATASDGSFNSGGAVRISNATNNNQVFSMFCSKGPTAGGLDYAGLELKTSAYDLMWLLASDKKIYSPSGGTLLDSAISNNNITGSYTFTGALGSSLRVTASPTNADASTIVPNTNWIQSNFINRIVQGGGISAFTWATDPSQIIEVGFNSSGYAYFDFHSYATRGTPLDYDARIYSTSGNATASGGGTLGILAAAIDITCPMEFSSAGARIDIQGSDSSYLWLGGGGYSPNGASGAVNRSAQVTWAVSQRSSHMNSYQYVMEVVGTKVVHVLGVENSDSPQVYEYQFDFWGNFTCASTYANYGDLAELYVAKENYRPGTFVHITHDDDVDYEISAAHGNHCIFGVISTKPGLLINSVLKETAKDKALPVALTGRVPALIVGPIRKGSQVMLSDLPGIGKAGSTKSIGFALETNLDHGVKLVEIAIGGRG